MLRSTNLIFCMLVLLPLMAAAQGKAVQINSVQNRDQGARIKGLWPNACNPHVKTWSRAMDGTTDVLLANSASHCPLVPHVFSLTLRDSEQFSPALPAGQVYPLRVFAAGQDGSPDLVGFSLQGGLDVPRHPDAGFWWPQGDQSGSGNVLSLETQDGALGVALLSHDDLSGAPIWYFGTSQLQGSVSHVELTRMDDGSSPFFGIRAVPQPQPAMRADIEFTSNTRARVWLSRATASAEGGIDLVEMRFARRSFSNDRQQQQWMGSWLLAMAASPTDGGDKIPDSLEFVDSRAVDGRHTRLMDRSGNFALDCQHDGTTADAAAQHCALRDAAGNTLVDFDQVGLDRLDGRDSVGRAVIMLRPRS